MIRLILLLLGAKPLRKYWKVFIVISILSLLVSVIFIENLFSKELVITTDLIGVWFIIEGIVRLISLAFIGFPNATLSVIKSLGFFAIGFIAIHIPWDDGIVAAIVIGAALVVDGLFRLGSAFVIRSIRWRQLVIVAIFEFVIAGLIWSPWPIPYSHTVPFCIGLALLITSWSIFQLGLQLRQLPLGASVTDLPLFAGPNWHARGLLHPSHTESVSWNNDQPLTVHIWTPVISATHPQRRPIIDRYIAAMDQNGVISTGHAALSGPPNVYVSLVPGDDIDHSPTEFTHLLRADAENDVTGKFQPSLEEESAEWKEPDRNLFFYHYNSAALRAFVDIYRRNTVYNLTRRNCSSTVILSLDSAVEGALGSSSVWRTLFRLLSDPAVWLLAMWRSRAEAMTWTPGLVLDYTQTLQQVLEGHSHSWFARLSDIWYEYETRWRKQSTEGQQTRSNLPAMISIVATAMIFGLTYGLSAPLIAFSFTQLGFDQSLIGANAAMQAVGVLVIAPFLPKLAWRTGPKLPISIALLSAATIMALFPIMPSVWWWFPLRLALGAASETLFVMTETWISQLSNEGSRARTMAIYTAAVALGFAIGPALLSLIGSNGLLPYLLGGGFALLALLAMAMPWVQTPVFERPSYSSPLRYLSLIPIALGATLVNAALETAGLSFLPLYAMRLGWSESSAMLLLSVLLLGAILLQVPIGWLGDRLNWRKLVIGLGLASFAGALIWSLGISTRAIAYPLLFVWGGLFVGIYTIMMTVVGSKFQGGDLVSVYSLLSVAWGIGAFIGPSSAGVAMQLNQHGLPIFAAIACGAFTLLAILLPKKA